MAIVAPPTPLAVNDSGGARFDWYACTVNSSVEKLRDVLCDELGGEAVPEEGAKHGFHFREVIKGADGRTLATLLFGGNGDLPHAYASSDATDEFVRVIRHYWPDRHRVSRMDSAIDFDGGDGTWDELYELCGELADGIRVEGDTRKRVGRITTGQMGNWRHAPFSRTFYLGAMQSAVLMRLYEKGIKVRTDAERHGKQRPDVSDNWVRAEIQVRPDGDSKRLAATASPLDAWGYSAWSRELLRRLVAADVERVIIKEQKDSEHERAMQWMVKQYGGHLLEEVAALGSWEALGISLRRRMEEGGYPTAPDDDDTPF